jgi:uncharacterized membrane protein (UPF0127 family)
MKFVIRTILLLTLSMPGVACGQEEADGPVASNDGRVRETLIVFPSDGDAERLEFQVEIALTSEQQTQGLMFRESMGEFEGMLFVFPNEELHNFWMKNTLLPLDIIFIRSDGTIATIAERTTPLSEALVPSRVPVRSVLELNGGTAEKIGLRIGDRVSHTLIDREHL